MSVADVLAYSAGPEGPDPLWRPVAYVVGGRFNTLEPRFLKKPAQPTPHIRLGDPRGPPHLLADVVKASWASDLFAGKNKTAVIHRCRTDHAAVLRDTPQFGHNIRRIVQCLKHRVAKNWIERRIMKRQPSTVGDDKSKVSPPHQGRGAVRRQKAVLVEIDANHSTVRNRLSQAQRDCRLATPAIEYCHVRAKVREEKASVDIRAARPDRGLHLTSCPCSSHCTPIAKKIVMVIGASRS